MGISTKKLVLTALFTALVTITTMLIRIPLPLGYFNLGDAFIFLAVFILGPLLGTIATGIGSTVADLIGFIAYAPGTLIIKTLMSLTASLIYKFIKNRTTKIVLAEISAGIIATLMMALGYFIYETILFTTVAIAIVNVPYNLLQGGIGIVFSVVSMRILNKIKILDKLQK